MARQRKRAYPPGIRPLDGRPGWWRVRFDAVDPKTGASKEHQRHFQGTLDEATVFRAKERVAVLAGGETRERTRFQTFAVSWLRGLALRGANESTVATYASRIELHIRPTFGLHFMDQISSADVDAWLRACAEKTQPPKKARTGAPPPEPQRYTARAINAWLETLQAVIRAWAIGEDLPEPAAARVAPLKVPPKPLDAPANSLGQEALRRILGHWRVHDYFWFAYFFLGSTTGMRPGELAALDRTDLDPARGLISITKNYRGPRLGLGPPKNGKPRTAAYTPVMQSVMEEHVRRVEASGRPGADCPVLFPGPRLGRRLNTAYVRKVIRAAAQACGLGYVTPKGMRRTFNDLMRLAGHEGVVLRAIVGHATSAMTDTYSTVSTAEKLAAVGRVVSIVQPEPDTKPDTAPTPTARR